MNKTEISMYKHFNDGEYTALRKNLLKEPGSGIQKSFVQAALSNDEFIQFVREKVSTEGSKDIPALKEQLTENQYKDPPPDTENMIYDAWKMIPPKSTCSVSFWGEVTLGHIENGRIDACYLAANGGPSPSSKERIDKSLSSQGSKEDIASCVRTILRQMSGLPEKRGSRTQYVDCPFGRAWWRKHLLEEIAEATKMSEDKFREILYFNKTYWENLVSLVVSRNSILGDKKVRHALIWALADAHEKELKNKILQGSSLSKLCRLLGVRLAWQELGILELVEIKKLIEDEMFPQLMTRS